jgi:hypothetical protein
MRLLLEEHRRADESAPETPSVIDELSKKRTKASAGG